MKVANHKYYALFEYSEYLHRGQETTCDLPQSKRPYDLGDVVYIKEENSIGVVLGCIDYVGEELRTDMDGMKCFSQIEMATKKHFKIEGVRVCKRLKGELS